MPLFALHRIWVEPAEGLFTTSRCSWMRTPQLPWPPCASTAGGSIGRLSERLARRGILIVVAVRIIPVAPFTVISLFAGASHIRFRDYLIGTLIGMIPGVAAMAVFAEGILALVRDADLKHFLVAALALVLIVGLTLLARRLFGQLNGRRPGN